MTSFEAHAPPRGRRIVLVTIGSWGDVLPYLAIALGLQERGHQAIVATSACHRPKVEALGISVRSLRPDSSWVSDPLLMRRRSHPTLGLIRVATDWLLPALKETYEDATAAVEGADLIVSHPLAAYAVRLVAEKTRLPWVSTMLVPLGFFSVYDETGLPMPAILSRPFRWLGPRSRLAYLQVGRHATRFLAKPWYRLRAEVGLPPATDGNPLADSHSPELNLALFSKILADAQPDWPPRTVITGFPISSRAGGSGLPAVLNRFLEEGPPPIVFTLGTAVGNDAGRFYEISLEAARSLGYRTVLVGSGLKERIRTSTDAIALDYAPFTELFPRAAAIVHHGGIGTTGLAMQSGRPSLVMPRAWDQPDNAARAARLGIARIISPRHYSAPRIASELRCLLDGSYQGRAETVREQMSQEDGVRAACDAIESHLAIAMGSPVGRAHS